MTDRRGATLISVMVSAVIITIALTIAASAFYSASRLRKQSEDYTQAGNFAEGVMERTLSAPYADIKPSPVTDGLPKLADFKCSVDVKPQGTDLKEVIVRYSWRSGKLPRQARLSTLVAKGEKR